MSEKDDMETDEDVATGRDQAKDRRAQDQELNEQFPNRPKNHSRTLPFHSLFQDLFNPLNETKKTPVRKPAPQRLGPHAGTGHNPREQRRIIIERYISRWRRDVGNDLFPAFRLIVPDKDRDRAMYGLKEKALGRYLVKIMKIDKNSEDGFSLLNWKLPGQTAASRMAGDFAGRCYEVLSKRPFRVEVGDMTIGEVNDELDDLAQFAQEQHQLPILEKFYRRMNAEEMMWLIRIILREMKIGATERTLFDIWHPDAGTLFNISSSLRRVCWELWDPSIRLEGQDRGVALLQCFQPQLAQFQIQDFKKIVSKMRPTEEDSDFWIEEKLDGERMQLHMVSDNSEPGGRLFQFWSRKAKDYTYLYGKSLFDKSSALTQFLRDAFHDGVENIILDGEMITWDPETDRPVAFGTLKTAALSEQDNPFAGKHRPLFRVFDILLLNDRPLTQYTLRDRRKALEASVKSVHRRFEIHTFEVGTKPADIEASLRDIVTRASEGLVIKSPRSAYRLNSRNDDWMKVKPEYMTGFGESLDVLIIGGYYGSGKRGGGLSSFLCGLRADEASVKKNYNPQKFLSFCKVGGGLTANDYATIRHLTDGKWIDWDSKKPPLDWVELGGGMLQREKPDVWIKPPDSVVIEAKAASIAGSDEFGCGLTLRFPRFVKVRQDKDWQTTLSMQEFLDLKSNVEATKENQRKEMEVDDSRKKKRKIAPSKRSLVVAGYTAKDVNAISAEHHTSDLKVFANLTFYIMTDCTYPQKKSKPELEELVKAHGGKVVQTHSQPSDRVSEVFCIAERRIVKVASLVKQGQTLLIKPVWVFDCVNQAKADLTRGIKHPRVLVWEPERHLYFIPQEQEGMYEDNVDQFGDALYRDTSIEELRELMAKMNAVDVLNEKTCDEVFDSTINNDRTHEMKGSVFRGCTTYFHKLDLESVNNTAPSKQDLKLTMSCTTASFGDARISADLTDKTVTHIIVSSDTVQRTELDSIRKKISSQKKIPHIITEKWIEESWKEGTRLDEERFVP